MVKLVLDKINRSGLSFVEKYEVINNVRVLRFKGSIDAETIPAILRIKEKLMKDQDMSKMNVLLDLKNVEYADSAALAALIMRVSEIRRKNKKLGLMYLPEKLKNILDIFRCDKLFLIFESEEKALKALK